MDTKSGTILATGRTSLVDGPNLPESEEQPVATKPLTEIQVHAVDLSLKSPQSLPPYSQSLHFKDTQKANRGKKRRCSGMESEESGDNITHTSVDPGVQKTNVIDPSLPDTDSIDTSGKETHSHSMVVLKDEIEEVCIGDSHGYWQGDSYPPVSLNEIKTEDKGSKVTSDDGVNAPEDSLGTIKEQHHDAVMYEVGFLAKDTTEEKTTVSERQRLDLTGFVKSNLLTGLSAELRQSMENWSSKNELSDSMQNSDENNEKEEANFPFVKGLGKRKEQRTNEPDTGRVEKEKLVIPKMEGKDEALNLSLPQKAVCNHTAKLEKYAEDGTGSQSTLVMEVDEIMQREEDEEEEQNDNSQALFDKEPAVVRVNVSDWGPKLSPPSVSLNNSPTSSTAEDLDGLLLIDDQGIPYTLTPDGKKVIQVAPSKSCKASMLSRTKLKASWVEAKDSGTASSPDHDLPKKGLIEALPCVSSKEITPQLSTSGSAPKIVPLLNNKPSSQTAVISPSSLSSTLSNLASQPVKIMANPTSNILLVPSSHLPSPPLAKPTSNASLLTLSLPISLNPNPPSAPLFLVLSPLTTSSTPPSSLSSKVNVIDSIPSPLLSSNTQSSASASVPLSSGKTVTGSSSPSSGSLPVDPLNSGTPSTSIVGNGTCPIPSPDSPSVSSGNIRQPKPDLTSKTALPKLSRVKTSESPSKPDSTNVAANQTESSTSPVSMKSSPVKSPKSNTVQSSTSSSVCQTSKDSPPAPTPDTPADVFPSDQSHYESSETPPPTAIFPTNHPKNFSLSSSCPRRILYCQYCPRAFYYLSDLERHSITHSQSKPYVCPLCNKAFKRSSHLERHKHIHTGQRNFICPICSKRFREAGELLRHQRVHTGEKPFQCPQCHMRFAERNTLRRHTKRKHHELNGHGDGEGMPGGQEESAEWYSCAVPDMDSDTEPDKD
ncbi:uncharacterized protein LOC125748938 [Brienomyrus brachyistius]|uniref:uncharacterized protein LOC125748938 n=1 Tax=Brienomyrus brachyistius TaxID=42636 RepID=UPI0020B44B1D|nr:uncharacterized protein LOC125748938 [Brienomyrus brachyistius]